MDAIEPFGTRVAALVRGLVGPRVQSPRDLAPLGAIPVLGDIPADRSVVIAPLVLRTAPTGPAALALRALWARLERHSPSSILLTGPEAGHGTTTVAVNLALAAAASGSVVVVDADFESAAASRMLGIHGAPGLGEILSGRAGVDALLREGSVAGVSVLPAGRRQPGPGLASDEMRTLLGELRARFDLVLVDAPPVLTAGEVAVLGSSGGDTILVVGRGSHRATVEEALAVLGAAGSTPGGIVITGRLRRDAPRPARHLADPLPASVAPVAPAVPVAPPVPVSSVASEAVDEEHVAEPMLITEVEHTLGAARELDSAFAALPAANVQRAPEGRSVERVEELSAAEPAAPAPAVAELPAVEELPAVAGLVERPVLVRPDIPRPSRFAPDPVLVASAYASAPPPVPGTENRLPAAGTRVDTVSVRLGRDAKPLPPAPPPIRHILPRPTAATLSPREVEAVRTAPVRAITSRGGAPVRERPVEETRPVAEAVTRAIPVAGSLLGEIGGLPRVEVRAVRPRPIPDAAPDPEREARESYEQRARELERVAQERLRREQQRLAASIREQLAHDKRELESVLDNRLEDTVLHPRRPV